jgi:hypothetical protein
MRYCRKEDVVARSAAGEHLLVPIHGCTSSVYILNDSGRLLWGLIGKPRTEDELASALAERFRIPRATATRDVRAFLEDMVRMGLAQARA